MAVMVVFAVTLALTGIAAIGVIIHELCVMSREGYTVLKKKNDNVTDDDYQVLIWTALASR